MVTKNDLYAAIIKAGIQKRFIVIPEFRVNIPDTGRTKDIDLVWARKRPDVQRHQAQDNLDLWSIFAAFEIEACDVRPIPGKEFYRHMEDFPYLANKDTAVLMQQYVVLYTKAYDRAGHWRERCQKKAEHEILLREMWAYQWQDYFRHKHNLCSNVEVKDGRDLSWLKTVGYQSMPPMKRLVFGQDITRLQCPR